METKKKTSQMSVRTALRIMPGLPLARGWGRKMPFGSLEPTSLGRVETIVFSLRRCDKVIVTSMI